MNIDPRQQRADLCDLLEELGPEQPTLCQGWLTRDLAAHLVLRERRPLAAGGIMLSPLSRYTAAVQRRLAARPYDQLIALLRRPPAWSPLRLPALDRAVNTVEWFVHHEDVRRAQPRWQPRPLPAGLAKALWTQIAAAGRLRLRRFPATVVLAAPGYGSRSVGRGGPELTVTGDPGELTLFCFGRQPVAQVELTGPPELAAELRAARLGV